MVKAKSELREDMPPDMVWLHAYLQAKHEAEVRQLQSSDVASWDVGPQQPCAYCGKEGSDLLLC